MALVFTVSDALTVNFTLLYISDHFIYYHYRYRYKSNSTHKTKSRNAIDVPHMTDVPHGQSI